MIIRATLSYSFLRRSKSVLLSWWYVALCLVARFCGLMAYFTVWNCISVDYIWTFVFKFYTVNLC